MTNDRERAEEMVFDVFVRLWRSAGAVDARVDVHKWMHVQLRAPAVGGAAPVPPNELAASASFVADGRPRILLIERDRDVAGTLAAFLDDLGFDVAVIASVQAWRPGATSPDLVIVDLGAYRLTPGQADMRLLNAVADAMSTPIIAYGDWSPIDVPNQSWLAAHRVRLVAGPLDEKTLTRTIDSLAPLS
ncbi:MAG: hypothetical protein ACR2K4_00890 [Candidatus Limnocylindria bacterium]